MTATSFVWSNRLRDLVRIDGAAFIRLHLSQCDEATIGHGHQRARHAIMLEVGRDDVIAGLERAFHRHVQRIGAVQRKDEPLRPFAVHELVQSMAGIVERMFGRERHLVPGPSRVGERRPREAVHREVNRLGLRETGRRIIEVDHSASLKNEKK